MPPTINVTPIRATIHYDDFARQWHLHASKLEQDSRGNIKDLVIENFDTFAQLLVMLLQIWAMSGAAGTSQIKAPMGDLSIVGAAITAGPINPEVEVEDYPTAIGAGTEAFEDNPAYDGVADNWGQTEAGP